MLRFSAGAFKNVHAYIAGTLIESAIPYEFMTRVSYDPYRHPERPAAFFIKDTGEDFAAAERGGFPRRRDRVGQEPAIIRKGEPHHSGCGCGGVLFLHTSLNTSYLPEVPFLYPDIRESHTLPISIICPGCGKQFVAPDDSPGSAIDCLKCGKSNSVPIPLPSEPDNTLGQAASAVPIATGSTDSRQGSKRAKRKLLLRSAFLMVLLLLTTTVVVASFKQWSNSKRDSNPTVTETPKTPVPVPPRSRPVHAPNPSQTGGAVEYEIAGGVRSHFVGFPPALPNSEPQERSRLR